MASFDPKGNVKVSVISGWMLERIRMIRYGEFCDNLEFNLTTEIFSDAEDEREGWYFRKLQREKENLPPIYKSR